MANEPAYKVAAILKSKSPESLKVSHNWNANWMNN